MSATFTPRATEVKVAVDIIEATLPVLVEVPVPVLDETGEQSLDPETGEPLWRVTSEQAVDPETGEPLTQPAYDDAESMARALVRAIGGELSKRDAYLVVVPDASFCYGPYWTETQAKNAWTKDIGPNVNGSGRIAHSFSWEGRKGGE